MEVKLYYWFNFGKCDSEGGEWTVELTDEEAALYKQAAKDELDLDEVEGLKDALDRVREDILEQEMDNAREVAEIDDEEFDEEEFLNTPFGVRFAEPDLDAFEDED